MQSMAEPTISIVLFADITQGSGLFSELGDTWAVDVVASVHARLGEVTKRHCGRIVKTVGTEMLCTFDSSNRAAMASGDMHLAIRNAAARADPNRREEVGLRDVRLRVGIHLGPVIEDDGDVFGDTVNVTARLMAMAKADQILCSRHLVDGLSVELRSSTRYFDKVSPRGKTETIEIHEILWEVEDLTMAASVNSVPQPRRRHARLLLQCAGEHYELGDTMPSMSIGRSADNDPVFPGGFASRRHAQIEYARGRFTIVDQSANGTYVVAEDGTTVPVRRDTYVLDGGGKIYLGELPGADSSAVIVYICE